MAMITPKILYIITRANLGGAQTNVLDLIDGLRMRYDVRLATGEDDVLTARVRALGMPVYLLPRLVRRISPLSDLAAVWECAALIRRIKPGLIHAHSSKAGIIARVAGWLTGVPVVFTAHGWGFSPGAPPLRRAVAWLVERAVAPLSARIICVSENDRRLALRARVGTARVLTVIRYGIGAGGDVADPATQPPCFIMVARFNEQKDQETLLRAFAQLTPTEVDGAQITFVGSGPALDHCRALAATLGITDRVAFLGDREDVPDLLVRAHGFVLSTHYEGLPISILEAMRAGLPVVATAVSGIPEEVSDGETGLLVPHGDVDALATALRSLIHAPERRRQFGEAGHRKFHDDFTLERMLAQSEAVYRDILGRSRA